MTSAPRPATFAPMAAAPTTTWLVTGFPSWIARSIVREIAEQEEGALVHLLVPEDRAKEAAEFCRGLRALGSTVKVLPGDAVRMDLGLTGKDYVALAGSVDLFVNAYDVSPLRDDGFGGYGGLYGRLGDPVELTVKAVREAVEFALLSKRLRQLVQIGSLTVAGDFDGVWTEEDLSIGQRHRTAAERARHGAERLLWRERERVRFTILRTGPVVGDSRTGEIGWYHGPHDLLEAILVQPRRPVTPEAITWFSITLHAVRWAPAQSSGVLKTHRRCPGRLADPRALRAAGGAADGAVGAAGCARYGAGVVHAHARAVDTPAAIHRAGRRRPGLRHHRMPHWRSRRPPPRAWLAAEALDGWRIAALATPVVHTSGRYKKPRSERAGEGRRMRRRELPACLPACLLIWLAAAPLTADAQEAASDESIAAWFDAIGRSDTLPEVHDPFLPESVDWSPYVAFRREGHDQSGTVKCGTFGIVGMMQSQYGINCCDQHGVEACDPHRVGGCATPCYDDPSDDDVNGCWAPTGVEAVRWANGWAPHQPMQLDLSEQLLISCSAHGYRNPGDYADVFNDYDFLTRIGTTVEALQPFRQPYDRVESWEYWPIRRARSDDLDRLYGSCALIDRGHGSFDYYDATFPAGVVDLEEIAARSLAEPPVPAPAVRHAPLFRLWGVTNPCGYPSPEPWPPSGCSLGIDLVQADEVPHAIAAGYVLGTCMNWSAAGEYRVGDQRWRRCNIANCATDPGACGAGHCIVVVGYEEYGDVLIIFDSYGDVGNSPCAGEPRTADAGSRGTTSDASSRTSRTTTPAPRADDRPTAMAARRRARATCAPASTIG